MTVTHYPLDRTASHLVLQLNDLRINERVANVNDHKQLDQFMPDLLCIADTTKRHGRDLDVNKLVITGLAGCVSPGTPLVGPRCSLVDGVGASVRVLKELFISLSSQFQLEIFGVTGYALSGCNELLVHSSVFLREADAFVYLLLSRAFQADPRIVFRGFQDEALSLCAGESSFLLRYQFALDARLDLPIQHSLTLAEVPVSC